MKNMTTTILYYTSNREEPSFEAKIIQDMLSKKGDLPVISISQKPMEVGYNICVGDVGLSYVNEWRQILLGCKRAMTDYVIMSESDFIYPPEYFQFEPTGEDFYLWDNVWIAWRKGVKHYHRKRRSEGAMIMKREFFIDILEKYLSRFPEWTDKTFKELGLDTPQVRLNHSPFHNVYKTAVLAHGEHACISFKTGQGCNYKTGVLQGEENQALSLPYWGDINDLKAKFL